MNTVNTTNLFQFLHRHKYQNLHTRHKMQVNKVRVMKHLHGMKLKNPSNIMGYFCGKLDKKNLCEIEYEINLSERIRLKNITGMNAIEASNYIEKETSRIMEKTLDGPQNGFATYLKGNFYLRRNESKAVSPAGRKAIRQSVLSEKFVNTMADWNLSVIVGSN